MFAFTDSYATWFELRKFFVIYVLLQTEIWQHNLHQQAPLCQGIVCSYSDNEIY